MYRKKNFISLGMSLVLAAGITVTPVTAADFTDGTVPEFNSDDATEFDVQQETADNAEFASGDFHRCQCLFCGCDSKYDRCECDLAYLVLSDRYFRKHCKHRKCRLCITGS